MAMGNIRQSDLALVDLYLDRRASRMRGSWTPGNEADIAVNSGLSVEPQGQVNDVKTSPEPGDTKDISLDVESFQCKHFTRKG